jgi:hypothetical protein
MHAQRWSKAAAAALLAATLAACGGGGGGGDAMEPPPQANDEVPASAAASPKAWVQYAGTMKPSDSAEGLSLARVTPPTSETDEPIQID